MYVAELAGRIWIIQDGIRLPEPMLDLTSPEHLSFQLLSFNFHPRYKCNGRAFLFYAVVESDAPNTQSIKVVEIKRHKGDSNKLDSDRTEELLSIPINFEPFARKGGDVSM